MELKCVGYFTDASTECSDEGDAITIYLGKALCKRHAKAWVLDTTKHETIKVENKRKLEEWRANMRWFKPWTWV